MLPARRLLRSPRAAIISARILSSSCAVLFPFIPRCDARSGSLILSVRLEFQHDVITDLSQRPCNFVKSHAACGSPQQRPSPSRHSCMDMLDIWLYFQHSTMPSSISISSCVLLPKLESPSRTVSEMSIIARMTQPCNSRRRVCLLLIPQEPFPAFLPLNAFSDLSQRGTSASGRIDLRSKRAIPAPRQSNPD